jgi:hypothetical protein
MALSAYGNRIGRAARQERIEQKEAILEAQLRQKAQTIQDNRRKHGEAMDALRAADPNWSAWYDSDAVPETIEWLNIEPVLKIIYDHIESLSTLSV